MGTKKPSPGLEQRVLGFIRRHHLVTGQSKLLVAVSGGPDSVCLLNVLVNIRTELGLELHVAHLNHQLRGAEADADARYVADIASRLNLAATIEQRDVTAYQARHHLSLEEAAREVRYAFLAEVGRSIGVDRVAVGHTMDDQVETILMHLIRGAGIRGLRGLQPSGRWLSAEHTLNVIRPLLEVSRNEIEEYCRSSGLVPRNDTSNLSLSNSRNRIRHQLLPLLREYNPQVDKALLRTARIASDDHAFLEEEGFRLWNKIAREENETIILDKEGLRQLPISLKRYLFRVAVERLIGNIKDIEAQHIEQVIDALSKPSGKRIGLPHGLSLSIEYDRYVLGRDETVLSPLPVLEGEFPLVVLGETLLPGWRVEATIIGRKKITRDNGGFSAKLDLDKTGNKLVVRTRRPGDSFQPLGMCQPKRLAEFMVDARVPRAWRKNLPLVCSARQVLWVVGWRIDDRVKVTDTTERVLSLSFKRR